MGQEEVADNEAGEVARAEPRRDGNGRWLSGQTGNPSGRPVVLAGVRELARTYTRVAVHALVDIAVDTEAPAAARVAAARELLDRGHGRPRPATDKPGLEFMTDAELDAEIEFDAGAHEAAAVLGIVLDGAGDPISDEDA